jgi:hypothetical protein
LPSLQRSLESIQSYPHHIPWYPHYIHITHHEIPPFLLVPVLDGFCLPIFYVHL